MSARPRLDVDDVSHTYDARGERVAALRDVSLSVSPGDVACLVGASGCGKSTLLRIAAGLLTPTEGSVAVGGDSVTGIADEVGVVFQNYDSTLLQWKTVYENVHVGARLGDGTRNPDEVTRSYLELVGLDEFADRMPSELSGGMKQRVQVARMLAYDPGVLLCDEPFGALDAQTKRTLQEEFLELLREDSTTTLFVTHDIEEALFLGDEVHVFTAKNPGRIEETISVPFDRPRFPKSAFERRHADEVVRQKERVYEVMAL